MNFFSIKNKVKEKLKETPTCRDNDNLLIGLLIEELEQIPLESISAKTLVEKLKGGEYGSLESIRRCRQALQEKNEDLRGNLWDHRHKVAKAIGAQLYLNF